MNTLSVKLEDGRTEYAPGELIQGTAEWMLSEDGGDAEVHLLWHTEGKGSEDAEVIESVTARSSGRSGRCDFRWTLPKSPYSYSGTLLSIVWKIELVVDEIDEVGSVTFTMKPSKGRPSDRKDGIQGESGWVPSG